MVQISGKHAVYHDYEDIEPNNYPPFRSLYAEEIAQHTKSVDDENEKHKFDENKKPKKKKIIISVNNDTH